MKTKEILRAKKTAGILGIISFLAGIFFMNQTITGNLISTNYYRVNYISLIGVLLIICALVLGIYSLKK